MRQSRKAVRVTCSLLSDEPWQTTRHNNTSRAGQGTLVASLCSSFRLTTTSYLLLDVKLSDFLDSNFLHWLMIVKNLVTFWSEMTA